MKDLLRQCKGSLADTKRGAAGLARLKKVDHQVAAPKRQQRSAGQATHRPSGSAWQILARPSDHEKKCMDFEKPFLVSQGEGCAHAAELRL